MLKFIPPCLRPIQIVSFGPVSKHHRSPDKYLDQRPLWRPLPEHRIVRCRQDLMGSSDGRQASGPSRISEEEQSAWVRVDTEAERRAQEEADRVANEEANRKLDELENEVKPTIPESLQHPITDDTPSPPSQYEVADLPTPYIPLLNYASRKLEQGAFLSLSTDFRNHARSLAEGEADRPIDRSIGLQGAEQDMEEEDQQLLLARRAVEKALEKLKEAGLDTDDRTKAIEQSLAELKEAMHARAGSQRSFWSLSWRMMTRWQQYFRQLLLVASEKFGFRRR